MPGTCVYFGESGTGKSTQLGLVARYLYRRSGGKPIRIISADGGGWLPMQTQIDAGIIQPFNIQTTPDAIMLLRKLRQGWWPEEGSLVAGQMLSGKIIPPPGKNSQDQLRWLHENIGGYLVEGLTSMGDLLLETLRNVYGKIGGSGMSGSFNIVVKDERGMFGGGSEVNERLSANAQDHYGVAQVELRAAAKWFGALPVERVIISGHERKATDTDESVPKPIRGVELAGQKGTLKIPKDVGELIHVDTYPLDESKTKWEYRSYFQVHSDYDAPNVRYTGLKARVPLELLPRLLERYPNGYFVCTTESGLSQFLQMEDELIAQAGEVDRALVEEMRRGKEGEKK